MVPVPGMLKNASDPVLEEIMWDGVDFFLLSHEELVVPGPWAGRAAAHIAVPQSGRDSNLSGAWKSLSYTWKLLPKHTFHAATALRM